MSAHIIDKLLFLVIIVAAARVLWRFYPYRQVVVEEDSREVVAPEAQPDAKADPCDCSCAKKAAQAAKSVKARPAAEEAKAAEAEKAE